jgi:hypothetical protein
MLTPRQNDCWLFLAKYTAEHGYDPPHSRKWPTP